MTEGESGRKGWIGRKRYIGGEVEIKNRKQDKERKEKIIKQSQAKWYNCYAFKLCTGRTAYWWNS